MPYEPPPELAALTLEGIAELMAARKLPPVDRWAPKTTGDSHMFIASDGRWFHEGGEITRPAMVRAFSALLACDADGQHWLITPQEKLAIAVEDAAFIAVDVIAQGGMLAFRLNSDDTVIAGPEHRLIARGDPEVPSLYLAVRHGTEARLNRSTYGQVVEIGLAGGDLSVSSQGVIFPLVPG
jgi:hypothetical protein